MSGTSHLLVYPNDTEIARNTFSFDHAMAHRNVMAVMGPIDQWTVMPYWIDPTNYQAGPATNWRLQHQQAHDDFIETLPTNPTAETPGIPMAQNLIDNDLQDPGTRAWWTFNNHMQHLIASSAILPLPSAEPIPWWYLPPRRVLTYW